MGFHTIKKMKDHNHLMNGAGPHPQRDIGPLGDFLRALLSDLSASAGALWVREASSGTFRHVGSMGAGQIDLFQTRAAQQRLPGLLAELIARGQPQAVNVPGLWDEKPNDNSVLLLSPVLHQQVPLGVIAVIQRGNIDPAEQSRQLQRLTERSADLVPLLHALDPARTDPFSGSSPGRLRHEVQLLHGDSQESPDSRIPPVDPGTVIDFLLNLQRSLDLNEVAGVAVNDGRLLFGADRVSLVLSRGRQVVVTAVSGQDSVHPRGNLIRAMRSLARQVVASGEPLRSDQSLDNLPPQLQQPLADFLQEGGARFLLMVPLLEPKRLVKPEEPAGNAKLTRAPQRTIGVLVVEQMANSEPSPQLIGAFDAVADHIAAAVFNAKSHSMIFLLPLWRSIGRFREWLRGRRLAIAAVVVTLLIAFGAALVLVPWEYRVDATGRLMPVVQREVFAPWDGQVVELLVQGGEKVEEGQVLLKLRNDELSAELVTVENQLREKRKLLASLSAQRDDADKQGHRDEALKLQGKAVETKVEIEGATLQAEILKDRRERLTIRAPIAGVVTTFQVEQLLLNRPVKRGDVLLQVMDDQGDWQLELEVAEHRLGRILQEQQRLRAVRSSVRNQESETGKEVETGETAQGDAVPALDGQLTLRDSSFPTLPIEYRLLTQPEASYAAKLTSLATRTVTAETQGSVIEARAALDKSRLPTRAIGAEVRARIGCGTSSLGDVLFGDVIEFVQKYLWW